jgi:hypothetical protein
MDIEELIAKSKRNTVTSYSKEDYDEYDKFMKKVVYDENNIIIIKKYKRTPTKRYSSIHQCHNCKHKFRMIIPHPNIYCNCCRRLKKLKKFL